MNIGFIGMGRMGAGMAVNLLKAGHQVTVYNRSPAKSQALFAHGAKVARSLPEACHGDAVISMLANDEAVEATLLQRNELTSSLQPDAIHICTSTISVGMSRRLAEAHTEADQHFIAAPVFGRPDAAAAARLVIVVAGEAAAVKTSMPLFEAIGQKTFVVSDKPETANLVKLGGNFLIASVIESLGEAFALVRKGGVDPSAFLNILTSSSFDSPVYKTYGGLVAGGIFEPAGFIASLGLKDVRLILAAAEELRVPMPLANLVRDRFLTLIANGGENLDWSAIGMLPAKDAGLAVK